MKLRDAAGWKAISRRQAKAGLRRSVLCLSARLNGKTVGMARVVGDGGYVMLVVDVIVLPEHRGKGVGTRMMEVLMDCVHASIADGEGVMLQLMAATGREDFYRQFGFEARPNAVSGAGMSQWIEA